ncbi:MAG: hypothetical protein ACOYWZ_00540 [Bacillota bacterium]
MDSKSKYQRLFLIFAQEDMGFREGGDPSGYVKVEVKEGKGRLTCQVSNLKEDKEKVNYKLYILKADEANTIPYCVGAVPLKKNKGELNWQFDPVNVGNTGVNIADFNVAAVLVEYNDRQISNVLCPLAAYKGSKVEWRNKLKKILDSRQLKNGEDQRTQDLGTQKKQDKEDIISRYDNVIESKYTKEKNAQGEQEPNKSEDYGSNTPHDKDIVEKTDEDKKVKEDVNLNEENNDKDSESKNNEEVKEIVREDKNENKSYSGDNGTYNANEVQKKKEEPVGKNYTFKGTAEETKYSGAYHKDFNSCANCFLGNRIYNEKPYEGMEANKGGIKRLEEKFDQCFEKCTPFMASRKDYKWWKVISPVHLNNILYQLNIKVPVLFNPLVLMAHFKYRHLIVGIYEDRERKIQYVVCGVPGVYWVDEKPFGDLCRWAQVEGNVPRYGAFGYWLAYINPETGKILSIN